MRGNAEVSQTDLRLAAITQMHQSSEKAWVGGLAVEGFGRTSESVAAVPGQSPAPMPTRRHRGTGHHHLQAAQASCPLEYTATPGFYLLPNTSLPETSLSIHSRHLELLKQAQNTAGGRSLIISNSCSIRTAVRRPTRSFEASSISHKLRWCFESLQQTSSRPPFRKPSTTPHTQLPQFHLSHHQSQLPLNNMKVSTRRAYICPQIFGLEHWKMQRGQSMKKTQSRITIIPTGRDQTTMREILQKIFLDR